jgi:signal transduction histidine kinase
MTDQPTNDLKPDLIIVDDSADNLRLLTQILSSRYKIRPFAKGTQALEAAFAQPPDLILLDVIMPGLDGFELAQHLRADPRTAELPIIFISALSDIQSKMEAFQAGGVDYITKPVHGLEVLVRVETHLTLRRLQQELQAANAQLAHQLSELQARNQELDAFAHTVAHDLKAPLGAILMAAELLKENTSLDDNVAGLDKIMTISEKMNRTLEGLMLLAGLRQTDVQPEFLDMAEMVQGVLSYLAPQVAENHARLDQPTAWPRILGHAPWVEEVWTNLVSNALKYGLPADQAQPPVIELGCDQPAELAPTHWRFWVRDFGPGLTPEQQARLFTPFEQLGRAHGHGLGLWIVKRIVTKLGGAVEIESTPGQGSRFFFTLPAG